MKKIIILISFVVLGAGLALGQDISFEYDDAGNRTDRIINVPPTPPTLKKDSAEVNEAELKEELAKEEEKAPFDKLGEANIKVFPNPTYGNLMVKLEGLDSPEGIILELYNQSGSKMKTQSLESNLTEFNLYDYSPGVYMLRICKGSEVKSYKIIKK